MKNKDIINETEEFDLLKNHKKDRTFLKNEKWYTKFKGIFYSLMSGALLAISSIFIKKSVFFSGFEQAAV